MHKNVNVQTGLTWKTFIVALNYPSFMHPHLRFSNFPHKSTYTCHYVYMYFEMLLARRQNCVHFEGMKVQQRWKNVCHGNIYSDLKHCSPKDTYLKNEFDVVIIAIFMPTHPSLVVQDLTSILKTLFDLNVSKQNAISRNL